MTPCSLVLYTSVSDLPHTSIFMMQDSLTKATGSSESSHCSARLTRDQYLRVNILTFMHNWFSGLWSSHVTCLTWLLTQNGRRSGIRPWWSDNVKNGVKLENCTIENNFRVGWKEWRAWHSLTNDGTISFSINIPLHQISTSIRSSGYGAT